MADTSKGILAMVVACVVWGLSPLFYKLLSHVPPPEVLAHRTVWSVVFFTAFLAAQKRLSEVRNAFSGRRQVVQIAFAGVMVSINWLIFILSIQIDKVTEASLGYYIFPLMAVLTGWIWFGETLKRMQWMAVGLAALAVCILTVGLGVAPWIALVISVTFSLYGAIKKTLPLGPVVSVTAEILILLPVWLMVLVWFHGAGQGAFATDVRTSFLLVLSGPLTAIPLILFSFAARRVPLSTVGLLQYINPTLQFMCAVVIFGEPFTHWHGLTFGMIWLALVVFSVAAMRGKGPSNGRSS